MTSLNLHTFQFIRTYFPNLQTLELTNPIRISGLDHEQHPILSEDFISNLTLQLPSIIELSFLLRSSLDDYRIFRRFISLLPNLIHLQMYIGQTLFQKISLSDDPFIRHMLMKIQILRMVHFYDERDKLSNDQMHELFPNAQILFH